MNSTNDLLRHFQECYSETLLLVGRYEAFLGHLDAGAKRVHDEVNEAAVALARAYLSGLDAAALAGAERRTGFRGFSRHDPLVAMARERDTLERTLARIRADDRYVQRQLLVGPQGVLVVELEERVSMSEPWEEEARKFEGLDGFLELLELGYDTPEFSESWWQPRYWKHWKQGDAICAELGLNDFGDDVLPAYRPVCDKRDEWRRQIAATRSKVADVHHLVQTHDAAVARIPELPARTLDQCHDRLADYLRQADHQLLATWNDQEPAPDRAVTMALRVLSGLHAKQSFLAELRGKGIDPFVRDLHDRAAKYHRKANKFTRSKYRGMSWPDSAMDLRFLSEKAPKYNARISKLEALIARVLEYDDYGRFDLRNDPNLWWLEFAGKRPPSLTPGLRSWYDRNPDTVVLHDSEFLRDTDPAARAVAVVSAARDAYEEQDYLS